MRSHISEKRRRKGHWCKVLGAKGVVLDGPSSASVYLGQADPPGRLVDCNINVVIFNVLYFSERGVRINLSL